jgi:hypothetical protein
MSLGTGMASLSMLGLVSAIFAAIGISASPPDLPRLTLRPLDGKTVVRLADLERRPRILLFWRSDCVPCRLELSAIADLDQAAGKGGLLVIALEPIPTARATLTLPAPQPRSAWVADEPAASVLRSFGGAPPRLPLAVAIDRRGRICAVRHGLLGSDVVRQWVAKCFV